MKSHSLRHYFLSSLVWVLFCMIAVACSNKESTSGMSCSAGYTSVSGTCVYASGIGGVGTPGVPPFVSVPNGSINDMHDFREFNIRLVGSLSSFECTYGSYPFTNCTDIQVGLAATGSAYQVLMASYSLTYQIVSLNAVLVTSGTNSRIFNILAPGQNNIVAQLIVYGTNQSPTMAYTLNFLTTANQLQIASGLMVKGIDYP